VNPPLFIAEGLFMYLPEDQLRRLMAALADRFPEGSMLIESLSVRRAGMTHRHDLISKLGAKFVWGIDSGRELESWHPRIVFVTEWSYLRFQTQRWRWLRYIRWLRIARQSIKISLLRFGGPLPADSVGG
jgi:O-methyltransferase involved in polyketide biosynthesis